MIESIGNTLKKNKYLVVFRFCSCFIISYSCVCVDVLQIIVWCEITRRGSDINLTIKRAWMEVELDLASSIFHIISVIACEAHKADRLNLNENDHGKPAIVQILSMLMRF